MELRTAFSRRSPELAAATPGGSAPLRLAGLGFGAKEGLATIAGLIGLLVVTSPMTRFIVPIGAPGSTLPNWILGVFSPLKSTAENLGQATVDAGMSVGKAVVVLGLGLLALAWMAVVRDADSIPLRALAWAIGGIYFLLLIAPPLFSTDIFTYLSAGRLQVLFGVNPYLHGPVVRPQDPAFGWTGLIWCDTPSVYGPIFTMFTAGLTVVGLPAGMWILKLVGFLSAGACAWLTWSIARDLGRPAAQAMAFVALNPLLLVYALGGGHNDLLMLAVVLAAVRLVIQAKPRSAGAVLGAAVAIKGSAGLVLPFLLVGARKRAENGAKEAAIGFAAVTAAVGVVATLVYGFDWMKAPATIANGTGQHIGELKSIPGVLAGYLGLGQVGPVARALLFALVLAVIVQAVRVATRSKDGWIGAAGVAIMASLALSTQLHPWYVIWSLPFAALSADRRVRVGAVSLTVAVIAIQAVRWLLPLGVGWPHSG
ncbi:MAG: DUF2029 domain-containing protein [Actinobacteria bacterium]|uniref:Unannotated protein n=1 Tax=freshwater metagenome TaxID=449393 RepID=A0A6J7E8X8_9ZZZZ|nr:DUF2029 domain-containing protein [Actinomycetota bacterium]